MKIFSNNINITSYEAKSEKHLPNFRAKKLTTFVTKPDIWKIASASAGALGMGILGLASKNKEDFSDLEKYLAEQTLTYESGLKEAAYNPNEIKLIIEMFKEEPELISKLIAMRNLNKIYEGPRFKAREIKMLFNAAKENPQLAEKLIYAGTTKDNTIIEYSYRTEDIVNIVELSKKQPEFINRVADMTKENPDGSFSPQFTENFEYIYLLKAYEKSPFITNELLKTPNLLAREISEITETFKNEKFFEELRNSYPEEFYYNPKVIKSLNYITQLISTPVKNLTMDQKETTLKIFTQNLSKKQLEIFHKYIPDFDNKITQLEIALGKYQDNFSVTKPVTQSLFIKNILANNNKNAENILKNFDFAQYSKEGLPLKYSRKDFIAKIEDLIKDLSAKEQDVVLQNFGLIRGHDGFDGLLTNKTFENKNVSQEAQNAALKISKEIELFTSENEVITGNNEADEILNGLIKGFPEFAFIVGKKQHGSHSYSLDIHTLKVLQSIMNSPLYDGLSDETKIVLKMSALLHDLGKKGGIKDDGHYILSSAYASAILQKFPFSEDLQRRVVEIVENHHWFESYNENRLKPYEIAAHCRYPEDIFAYFMFAKADIENINDNFHFTCTDNSKNQEEFEAYMKEKMTPIIKSFMKMRLQSNFVFDTKFTNNGEKFPKITTTIDGKSTDLKVLDFNKLTAGENLEKYGFAPDVTKESAYFVVHLTNNILDALKLAKNTSSKVSWSTSLVKYGANNSVEDKKFGLVFNANQANLSIADVENLSIGEKRSFEHFKNMLFIEESDDTNIRYKNYKNRRVFLRDIFKNELASRGYDLTDSDYIELAESIVSKKSLSQIKKDIEIGKHLIKASDLVESLKKTRDSLFSPKGHNEADFYNLSVSALFAKVQSLDECPQDFLRIASEYNLPIILLPPNDKI